MKNWLETNLENCMAQLSSDLRNRPHGPASNPATKHGRRRAFWLKALLLCIVAPAQLYGADSVAVENAKPGTTQWQLTNPAEMYRESLNPGDYANAEIQGYASRTSVDVGGVIDFYVRTINTNPYTLSVFRIGWYNGAGGRLVHGPITLNGAVQTMPPAPTYQPAGTGLVECNWNVSYRLAIPTDWVSGIYLAKLSLSQPAKESYIIFIVRDDARNSPILAQMSFATYQAYNEWGGSSLYTNVGSARTGYKVSFNRPFWRNFGAGDFMDLNGNPGYEIHLVRWLERQGYDVTYATDLDTHQNPNLLLSHKAFIVAPHDEYWSWSMRDTVERGRDAGVNLAFLGANISYWQIRFEPSSSGDPDRTVIGYKDLASMDHPSDPRYTTTLWRNIRPEGELIGVDYNGVFDYNPADIVITNASHWLFNGTGLTNGSILPNVLGYETDSLSAYRPSGTIRLAHSPFPKSSPQVNANMSIYTAPSGAEVFAVGTVWWTMGLDDIRPSRGVVPAVQQITANFLARALGGSPPTNPPPVIARLAATVTASSAAVGYPESNAGDSNPNTQWVATLDPTNPNNNTAWIALDFGAPKALQSVKWQGAVGSPYPAWSPTDYSIQISADGVNWQTVLTRSNSAPVVTGNEPLNASARFLRMLTSKVGDGSGWSLSFFEFWAEGSASVPGLTITTSALPSGTVGAAYNTSLAATGGTPPYSWSLASGALPPGLTLATDGTISGTPGQSGNFSFTARVTDSSSPAATATRTLALSVTPPPLSITTTTLPSGTVGAAYNSSLAATGGTPPYSWSLASGALPPGLTLSSGGTISGTPSQSGSFSFTAQVTDASTPTQAATQTLTLTVVRPPLKITTTTLPPATVGVAYNASLAATGGTPPYRWSIASGSLPLGLSLSSNGTISGTPLQSGSFSFTVRVTDSSSPAGTATQPLTLSVGLPLPILLP
jgi:N,N-dimethylformamidase beta subunit-like protein/F5/8 type C domain-containing protein/putative Ig domain-containing protein